MNLDEIRSELEDTDRQLLRCVARRQSLAAEIGRVKQSSGVPTRDYGQEREVVQRAQAIAGELGVSRQLAEELTLLLIQSSLTVQEQDRVASGGEGSGRPNLCTRARSTMLRCR